MRGESLERKKMLQSYLKTTTKYSSFRLLLECVILSIVVSHIILNVGIYFKLFPAIVMTKDEGRSLLLLTIFLAPIAETLLCQLLPYIFLRRTASDSPIAFSGLIGSIFALGHFPQYQIAAISVFPGGFFLSWLFIVLVSVHRRNLLVACIYTVAAHSLINGISYVLW